MDNTFSTIAEDFPTQEEAYKILKDKIIAFRKLDMKYKFYIYCYTLGKEEVFANLARDFKTQVKICKDRWKRLHVIGITGKYVKTHFEDTLNKQLLKAGKASEEEIEAEQAFLLVKPMSTRPTSKEDCDKHSDVIHIILSGWEK